jgi:hypothetical protein
LSVGVKVLLTHGAAALVVFSLVAVSGTSLSWLFEPLPD